MLSKKIIRKRLHDQRMAMSDIVVATLSRRIVRSVLTAIDWSAVQSIHIYQPIHGQREVDTSTLFEAIWQRHPEVKTATWQKAADGFVARWLDSAGVGSPVTAEISFSVIIVPMLGFNDSLHRIGYGRGFYDRYLVTQPGAMTVGLSYEQGRATFRPEAHDIALDLIITEKVVAVA